MTETSNYGLKKAELGDRINDFIPENALNLDTIDSELKTHADSIALLTPIKVTNAVPTWTVDTTYPEFAFRGTIAVAGATETMRPEVIFGNAEALSGNYAAVCESGAGVVYIYAKTNDNITIPLVVVHKE